MKLNKILCKIFGHKHPKDFDDDAPMYSIISNPFDGMRYTWYVNPCERCICYTGVKKITEEEYENQKSHMEIPESHLPVFNIVIEEPIDIVEEDDDNEGYFH